VVDVAASLVFRVVQGSFFWDASRETSVFNVWPFIFEELKLRGLM
jgi:hypothetical protein